MKNRDIKEKILNKNGVVNQTIAVQEELAELSIEVGKKILDQSSNNTAIIGEIADVLNMIDQLKIMYGISSREIVKERDKKLKKACKVVGVAYEG